MATKIRYYLNSSAIGSYFGVGFNEPFEQFQIDSGEVEDTFDDEAQARMDLGNILEDPVLDLFEGILKIIITDRNQDMMNFYDDKLKGIVDGMAMYNGLNTVIECKVSNAKSYRFTENMGYLFQVQAYMLSKGADQAILLGLYQGKPIFKVIPRDEEMIADIKEMADFVYEVLIGLADWSEYPTHLYEKYAKRSPLESFEDVTELDQETFKDIARLKAEAGVIKKQLAGLEGHVKMKFGIGKYEGADFNFTLSQGSRKGGFDVDMLSIEHPELDLEKYQKPPSTYQTIRVTRKKAK